MPFWRSQPLATRSDDPRRPGEISPPRPAREPTTLPDGLSWTDLDPIADVRPIHTLLSAHYLGLRWPEAALGWRLMGSRCLGLRRGREGPLSGFICATPATIRLRGRALEVAEVDLLCLAPGERGRGLGPALIAELTRQLQRAGTRQALFATAHPLPPAAPLATLPVYRRVLRPERLHALGWAYRDDGPLPHTDDAPLSPMEEGEEEAVFDLIDRRLRLLPLHRVLSITDVAAWRRAPHLRVLLQRQQGVPIGIVLLSMLRQGEASVARAVLLMSPPKSLQALVEGALRAADADIFEVLGGAGVTAALRRAGLWEGEERLQVYLYNWRSPPLVAAQVALLLR